MKMKIKLTKKHDEFLMTSTPNKLLYCKTAKKEKHLNVTLLQSWARNQKKKNKEDFKNK